MIITVGAVIMAINIPYFIGNAGVETLSTAYIVASSGVLYAGQVKHPEKVVAGFVTIDLPNI